MGSKFIGKDKDNLWVGSRNVDEKKFTGINTEKMVNFLCPRSPIQKNTKMRVKVIARQRQNSLFGSGSPK